MEDRRRRIEDSAAASILYPRFSALALRSPFLCFGEHETHRLCFAGCLHFDAMATAALIRRKQEGDAKTPLQGSLQLETGGAETIQLIVDSGPVNVGILRPLGIG